MSADRLTHLKIKIVNLADEARTIRAEERKALHEHALEHAVQVEKPVRPDRRHAVPGEVSENRRQLVPFVPPDLARCESFESLINHRRTIVRDAARFNLLAYGFLRGMPYAAMESRTHAPPDFKAVLKIATKFDDTQGPALLERWGVWLAAAEHHLAAVRKAA